MRRKSNKSKSIRMKIFLVTILKTEKDNLISYRLTILDVFLTTVYPSYPLGLCYSVSSFVLFYRLFVVASFILYSSNLPMESVVFILKKV